MGKDENLKFAEMANPQAWLRTADNLDEQALFLRKSEGRSILSIEEAGGTRAWDGSIIGPQGARIMPDGLTGNYDFRVSRCV
jgi:hypothetical protein